MGLNKWTEYLKPGNKIAIGARIKHDSPDITNRRVKVYYEFFYYRLGNYNWYENPYTTGKATINGVVKYNNTSQLVNLYHNTRHTVHSGNVWVSYGSSTTKSMPYKFEHDGSRVPPIDASIILSGNYTLPTISSTPAPKPTPTPTPTAYATLSSVPTTLRVGQTYTVSVRSSSSSYTHNLSLSIDGEYNAVSSRSTATKITFTVPDSSRFGTKEYLRGILMLHTYTSGGSYLGGDSYSRNVYPKPQPPTSSGVSIKDGSGSASGIFDKSNQVLMGLANLTATVSGATAVAPGASINQYEVILKNSSGATRMTATSSSSAVKLGTPNYSLSGSEVLDAHVRVRDTNGTWSNVNKTSSVLRIHGYSAPSGKGSVVRNGSSAKVNFEWSASSLKETSGAEEKNSVSVAVQSKPTGSSSWSGKHTHTGGASLVGKSSVDLSGYETVQGYDFRIGITDGFTTTYINIGSIGTEAVPLDLSKGGAGVGKIHSGSGAHLQVGANGIESEGGYIPIIIASGKDLDDYKTPGMYYVPANATAINIANTPVDRAFSLIVNKHAGVSQIFIGYNTSDREGIYQRNLYGSIWGAWREITTNLNVLDHVKNVHGSGSGLDADLLDGKHASTIISEAINGVKIPTIPPSGAATTGAVSGRGRWFKTGNLLICTQVAFINTYFSQYSITGSWTYPVAFSEAPFVQVAGGHDGMADNTYRMNGELSAYDVTATGTSIHFAGGPFASGNSKRVYMLAIGRV